MGATVTVACKLPNGLVIQNEQSREENEPVLGGGTRKVTRFYPKGDPVKLNGYAAPFGQAPKCLVVGGYALTPGVDAEFWEEWWAFHQQDDLVRNKILFAYERQDRTEAVAREHRSTKSGLEPMNMSMVERGGKQFAADERVPRAKSVTIAPADKDVQP